MAPKTAAAKAAAKVTAEAKAKAAAEANAKAAAIPLLAVGAPTAEEVAAARIEREITAERAAGALLTPVLPAALGTPGRVGTSLTPRPSPRPSRAASPAGGDDHLAPLEREVRERERRRGRRSDASDGGEKSKRRRRTSIRHDEARHMFQGWPFFQVQAKLKLALHVFASSAPARPPRQWMGHIGT